MPGPPYEVVAVRYATRETTKSECYYRYSSYGEPDAPYRMDYFFWLLRSGDETIVVDTGFDPEVGARRGRSLVVAPLDALARLGVEPGAVSLLVLTHLHYDHTGNLEPFADAELVLPRRELEFWSGPLASKAQFAAIVEPAEIERVVAAQRAGRVRLFDGSTQVAPGIEAIDVGGHSPGQAILVVEGVDGPVVLASDAIHFYEELERDRPFEVLADLAEMYAAYDVLREHERAGAVVVAGHDPEVVTRFAGGAGGVRVA